MAIYFDSFNRTNSSTSVGTSDSGHAYSAVTGYTALGISSNALYQPNASVGAAGFSPGVREFDTTITLGDSGTAANWAVFAFAANATNQTALAVKIVNTAVSLLQYTAGGVSTTLQTGATAVADAGTVRVRATKKDITVWVGTTLQFTFSTTLYPNDTDCFWQFSASSDVTIASVTMSAMSDRWTVQEFADNVRRKRKMPTTSTALPNAWFYDAIPEAIRLIQKEIPGWQHKQQITTASGTQSYSLDGGTFDVRQVWIATYDPMAAETENDTTFTASQSLSGLPQRYSTTLVSQWEQNVQPTISFSPIPDDAYTVNVWGRKSWTGLLAAMTDPVEIPGDWFDCVVFFLVGMSYEWDEDTNMADRWLAKAGDKLNQLKAIEEDRYNAGFAAPLFSQRIKIVDGNPWAVDL